MPPPALIEELARLTRLEAPSGFEEPALEYARQELSAVCSRVEMDVRGNICGWLAGKNENGPLVMVTAHADEIGFLITSIHAEGFLRFTKLGGPTDMVLPGQRVHVLTASRTLEGVIGVKPGHILAPDAARQIPPVQDMYIDIGAESACEAARWGVEPGTPVVFVGKLTSTNNPNRWFGKSVDNRMGVLAVLELARRLSRQPPESPTVFAIVVEEEIGLRGAEVATKELMPDVVLALDTVPAGGTPELRPDELPWSIGLGPLLKVRESKGLSTHGPLRRLAREVAERHNIPYQLIVDTAGITDATSAQQAGAQVAALTLGLARRYSHSAVEMFDLRDLTQLIDLTELVVREIRDISQLMRLP